MGSLPYETTAQDLTNAFSKFGAVSDAVVIMDKMTGRSKGFGFVTLDDDAAAETAIAEMNGSAMGTRKIIVNEARPMEPRAPRNGGNGGWQR